MDQVFQKAKGGRMDKKGRDSPTGSRFKSKVLHRLKVKGCKNIFHANGNKKKTGAAILIYRIDFFFIGLFTH